jgi:hypothetical protein
MRWCQASGVPGVTIRCGRRCLGSSLVKAAMTARSAQSRFRVGDLTAQDRELVPRTKISTPFGAPLRASNAIEANNRTVSR